jgi:hypothetical protein
MVAELPQVESQSSQAKGRMFTTDERRRGQATAAVSRQSPVTKIVKMQEVLMRRILNATEDSRDVASCACAWDKLEERRREALGKARLAPVKVDGKSKSSSREDRLGRVEPVPTEPEAKPTS